MLKLSVGVIFLSGFLVFYVVSDDKEDGQRANDDGSESNIAFDSADLTAVVGTVTGEYQLEAYRSINNDRILMEISKQQNSTNLGKISQLRWMSIGQPIFVKMPDVWNDYELFHEFNDGFSTHVQMLTQGHRMELASVARRKYSLNITADQITNLVLSKFECKIMMLDQHEEKHLLSGIVTDFRHFPLQMDFDAPLRSTARKLFLEQRSNIDLKFRCGLGTRGKLTKTNTLSITAQQTQDFGLEENLFGKASANESKDVFVNRNQLSELANEMYSRLNILEEYGMPEHQFSDAFVHGLIDQITSSQYSQVPIDEALASLSKYGFDVREDLRPDVIKRVLGSILTVENFENKSRIVVDQDEYNKLELSAVGKVLAKFGIPIKGITIGSEIGLDLSGSMSNESKVESLEEQLNELNSQSRNDMKWEFEGNRVVPKSLNVARLTRSKFSRTLTFNRVRTQSYIFPFSRQFTLYTHRALPEKPQTMYCACKAPMRHRLIQLEIELKTTNRQLERVTSVLKATIEHLQNFSQSGRNDEQEPQIPGTDQVSSPSPDRYESDSINTVDGINTSEGYGTQPRWRETSLHRATSKASVLSCPKPDEVDVVEFPPQCCSFPFTLNGQLHYRCILGAHGLFGCLIERRIWATCVEPNDFVAQNQTIDRTIPVVARFTAIHVHNWIVFQQRIDGSVSFNRPWEGYKAEFGKHDGNFWMGLEKIHKMTNSAPYKLRIEFMLTNGLWYSVEYDTFRVESEASNYKIHVTGYSGDVDDVMNYGTIAGKIHNGMDFTTYDRDNDRHSGNCASMYGGGWWYNACDRFNLNGLYGSWFEVSGLGDCSVSRMMMKKV